MIYFLPKKLIMFPWPVLAAAFFPFTDAEVESFGFTTGGAGSSSEKDSQTVSSFVTM